MGYDPKLGDRVRDRVTGFEGIVIAITVWLNGCRRATVQSRELKDGATIPAESFDVEQLELRQTNAVPPCAPTGGPCASPTRPSPPSR